ncbi:hypothetical protein SAMN04244560_00142 [Thermoanaerobacter thermohydrosulfuricus]|uniref:TrbC/VIRB2 family protein n=1 Tax=Thermoanaerobacter thermohydrosulfuricus TaxID=1516 RepID=A0A1G7HSV0_THETY|nr:pilin [Thermoanaerobacter thermohydrosulfuricus]SDF03406.1 hypothetical protein SAMN04244560_00142 [Thermoanaerobacter thermohydrosulfuricus]
MNKKIKAFFSSASAFMYSLMTAAYAAGDNVTAVDTSGVKSFIWNIVNALMDIAVVVAVGFIAWNGYRIMASSTNPVKRSEAMSGLLWAIAGAVVALGAKWFVGVALGLKPQ